MAPHQPHCVGGRARHNDGLGEVRVAVRGLPSAETNTRTSATQGYLEFRSKGPVHDRDLHSCRAGPAVDLAVEGVEGAILMGVLLILSSDDARLRVVGVLVLFLRRRGSICSSTHRADDGSTAMFLGGYLLPLHNWPLSGPLVRCEQEVLVGR